MAEADTFYRNYFECRVMPKISKDMGAYEFGPWMMEHRPDLYQKIEEAWIEINALWLSRGNEASFKAACKRWYDLHMEAKNDFDADVKRQQAVERTPAQAGLGL